MRYAFMLFIASNVVWAHDPKMHQAATSNAQFEQLKKLVGTWSGTAQHGEETNKTTVTYRLTGGGSTIIETQFADTPHEMVTAYYVEGKDVVLTHYCAAGNQPKMKAKPSTNPSMVEFAFAGGSNIKKNDMHMHNAAIRFIDDTHIEAKWESYKDNKSAGQAQFVLEKNEPQQKSF